MSLQNIRKKKQLKCEDRKFEQLKFIEYMLKGELNTKENIIYYFLVNKKELERELYLFKKKITKQYFKLFKLTVEQGNNSIIIEKLQQSEENIDIVTSYVRNEITSKKKILIKKISTKSNLILKIKKQVNEMVYNFNTNFKIAHKKKDEWENILKKKIYIKKQIFEIRNEFNYYRTDKLEHKVPYKKHEGISYNLDNLQENRNKLHVRRDYYFEVNKEDNFIGNQNFVYGTVAENIELNEDEFSRAISVAAGKCLSQIIVENKETSMFLFKILHERRSCIPLNEIKEKKIDYSVLKKARLTTPEADFVINLIKYKEKFSKPIINIFGSVLIVPDINYAKRLVFSQGIQIRCVTLDGDSVDPKGTMEGGFSRKKKDPLVNFLKWKEISKKIVKVKEENEIVETKIKKQEQEFKKNNSLNGVVRKRKIFLQNYTEQMFDTEVEFSLNENMDLQKRIYYLFNKVIKRKNYDKDIFRE